MKVILQRTVKVTESRPVLDKNDKKTGKMEEVATGEEHTEQRSIPYVDFNQSKEGIKAQGWEVVAEENSIDMQDAKFFNDQKNTQRNY